PQTTASLRAAQKPLSTRHRPHVTVRTSLSARHRPQAIGWRAWQSRAALRLPGSGWGVILDEAASTVRARDQEHTERGERDLDEQFRPVDTGRVPHAHRAGDDGSEQRGDDADEDGEPYRHVLATRYDQATQGA